MSRTPFTYAMIACIAEGLNVVSLNDIQSQAQNFAELDTTIGTYAADSCVDNNKDANGTELKGSWSGYQYPCSWFNSGTNNQYCGYSAFNNADFKAT